MVKLSNGARSSEDWIHRVCTISAFIRQQYEYEISESAWACRHQSEAATLATNETSIGVSRLLPVGYLYTEQNFGSAEAGLTRAVFRIIVEHNFTLLPIRR